MGAVAGLLLASAGNTTGAAAVPGATTNDSLVNRPTKSPRPVPLSLLCKPPRYQETPNGAFGTCITNKSKLTRAGNPLTRMLRLSEALPEVIVTLALPCGRQA